MSNFSGQKIVGVSPKMYMDHQATIAWAREVKARQANHRAVTSHSIEIFVLPTLPSISEVAAIKGELGKVGLTNYRVIYGGSAGPGLLNQVAETIDGLFLERMAHDPDALVEIVNEF